MQDPASGLIRALHELLLIRRFDSDSPKVLQQLKDSRRTLSRFTRILSERASKSSASFPICAPSMPSRCPTVFSGRSKSSRAAAHLGAGTDAGQLGCREHTRTNSLRPSRSSDRRQASGRWEQGGGRTARRTSQARWDRRCARMRSETRRLAAWM